MKVYKSEGRFEKKKHRLKKGYNKLEQGQKQKDTPSIIVPCIKSQIKPRSIDIEEPSIKTKVFEAGLPEGFWAYHITAHIQEI